MTPEWHRLMETLAGLQWWIGGGAVALVALLAWWSGRTAAGNQPGWQGADWIAVALLLAVLAAWRWSAVMDPKSTGLAEAPLLASALGLERDPVPFRSVDPGDSGWLTAGTLLLPRWLGLPPDFLTARLLALLFDSISLAAGYGLLRRWFPRSAVLPGLLPLVLVVGMARLPWLGEYSAWHLGTVFAVLVAIQLWPGPGRDLAPGWWARAKLLAAALCLGALPWTHRVAVLAAVGIWLVAVWLASRNRQAAPRHLRFVRQVGGLALYADVAAMCLLHGIGQGGRFCDSYVLGLAGGQSTGSPATNSAPWLGCFVGALAASGLLFAWARAPRRIAAVWASLAGVVLGLHGWAGRPSASGDVAASARPARSELGTRLLAMRQPGDALAVWGWAPWLHVETGLPPVTSSFTTLGEIRERGPGGLYRPRYLTEFLRNPPTIFVDAGASLIAGHGQRAQSRHELFPELAAFIEKHYRLVSDDGVARLYLRAREAVDPAAHTEPLRLEKMQVLQVMAPVSVIEGGRWFAHAPARFAYPVPPKAVRISGNFGFLPGAYEDAGAATDGAVFIVTATGSGDRRERLLERRLDPVKNAADRGPIGFALVLPAGAWAGIEFAIESGEGSNRDWTYWGDLQFDKAP